MCYILLLYTIKYYTTIIYYTTVIYNIILYYTIHHTIPYTDLLGVRGHHRLHIGVELQVVLLQVVEEVVRAQHLEEFKPRHNTWDNKMVYIS